MLVVDLEAREALNLSFVVMLKFLGTIVNTFWVSWSNHALLNIDIQSSVDFMLHIFSIQINFKYYGIKLSISLKIENKF